MGASDIRWINNFLFGRREPVADANQNFSSCTLALLQHPASWRVRYGCLGELDNFNSLIKFDRSFRNSR